MEQILLTDMPLEESLFLQVLHCQSVPNLSPLGQRPIQDFSTTNRLSHVCNHLPMPQCSKHQGAELSTMQPTKAPQKFQERSNKNIKIYFTAGSLDLSFGQF